MSFLMVLQNALLSSRSMMNTLPWSWANHHDSHLHVIAHICGDSCFLWAKWLGRTQAVHSARCC